MAREGGFTLLELMVVILILGVLTATAFPTYRTFHSRAIGAEASLMMKQVLDAEIAYYLEHDSFFPAGDSVEIYSTGAESPAGAHSATQNALNIHVQTGRKLDYMISILDDGSCLVKIASTIPLFKGGEQYLCALLTKEGQITYIKEDEILPLLGG